MTVRTLFTLAIALGGGALWAGCGETTCQRAQRINRDLFEKAVAGGCEIPKEPFIETDCEELVLACTPEDQQHLEDAMDCLEKVQCEPFKESQFDSNVNGCKPPLSSLSEDCELEAP